MSKISEFARRLVRFAAEAPHSLRNHLSKEELGRVLVAAFTAGGGTFGVLSAILANAGSIFPSPADAALAAAVATALLEASRRLGHGKPAERALHSRR